MAIVSWECVCEGDVDGFVFSCFRRRMDLTPAMVTFIAMGLRLGGEHSARYFALLMGTVSGPPRGGSRSLTHLSYPEYTHLISRIYTSYISFWET